MKKPLALTTTAALIGLSTLALAAPAHAETTVGDATFYAAADFGVESGGYPTAAWFIGDVSAPNTEGSITSSATGLDIVNGASNASQILHHGFTAPASQADLLTAINGTEVYASGNTWSFQVPMFGEAGTEFTTLRPAALGTLTGNWITSRAITDGAGTTLYAANAEDTLDNLLSALYQGAAPEVLAYGLWTGPDTELSVYAIVGFGDASIFTPVPTRTVTPNPATPGQAVSGVTLTGTGWFPGSDIYFDMDSCVDGAQVPNVTVDGPTSAGADGKFSIVVSFVDEPDPGTYCFYLDDDDVLYNNDVLLRTAMVVAIPAPQLAATGAEDATPWLIGAAGVLLLGAAAVVLSARARRRTSN